MINETDNLTLDDVCTMRFVIRQYRTYANQQIRDLGPLCPNNAEAYEDLREDTEAAEALYRKLGAILQV